jgi:hypothetical protein
MLTHKVLQIIARDTVGLMAHIGGVTVGNAHTHCITLGYTFKLTLCENIHEMFLKKCGE